VAAVLLELVIVSGLFVADASGLVPFSTTPFLLVLGWISLRLRKVGWRDVGFVRPRNWPRALAIGAAVGIGMELLALFVTEPLIARLAGKHPDLSDFRPLVGNPTLLIVALVAIANGRTLAVPIVAHGAANTLAFLLIYLDRYPGV